MTADPGGATGPIAAPGPAGAGLPGAGQLSPWWLLAGAAPVAILAPLGWLPEPGALALLALGFGVVVARHPVNGVTALVLASSFCLGEHKTPYFLALHLAVVSVLVSFAAHRIARRTPVLWGHAKAAGAWLAVAALALPLNLRDLLEDLWVFGPSDWSLLLLRGIPDFANAKYPETVTILGLGLGLFVVASQPCVGAAGARALAPLAALVALLAGFGLLRFLGLLETTGQYLTLSFWTWRNPDLRLTAIAWNPDYLAQFLVLALPAALTLGWTGRTRGERLPAAAAAILGALALLLTFQRAAYLSLIVAIGTLLFLQGRGQAPDRRRTWALLGAMAGLAIVALVLDFTLLEGRIVSRLRQVAQDPNRLRLWETALAMAADHPVLGVGTGRYAFFFHEYADPSWRQEFGPFWGTAHSTYLHLLAEQGVLGVAGFCLFFGGAWLGAFRRLPALPPDRQAWLRPILASLAGWLAYSAVQHTLRVAALFYLACILAGTAVALASAARRPPPARRWMWAAVGLALVVLAVRGEAALRRPVSPDYETGFHRWERQPGGGAARWTRRRAAMSTPVRGSVLEVLLSAPLPGLEARPQTVRVWVDRVPQPPIRLDAPGWRVVRARVREPRGPTVLVEVEVAYTVVPRALSGARDDRELGVMVSEVAWRDG